jgi:hypothetical protein
VKGKYVRVVSCLIFGILLILISIWITPNHELTKQPPTKPVAEDNIEKPPIKKEPPIQPTNVIPSPEIRLVFKNSALLTPARKNRITRELNAFRNYLVGLGFEVPKETPPIGTYPGAGGSTMAFVSSGDPGLDWSIYIGEKAIDDLTTWRRAYADYVFDTIFKTHSTRDRLSIRTWDAWIFTDYFASSYANQRPKDIKGMNGWVGALWEIRDSCGQDFTDRSLFYTHKSIIQDQEKGFKIADEEGDKVFNKYFSTCFLHGAWVLDNDFQNRTKIGQILRKYNLL